ncbi:U3 small nucleolar RNA-associated protein 14 homolog A [Xylocopa sonorina]|uniref:U3 small nucleolar RNA-associated protein 14 homolog A n=1 Tax=Xylocopa sonorina TaxID=1818115 RepID=UPI00403AA7D4
MDDSASDSICLDDTEQDVSESHSKLLDVVSQLDKGQRIKKAVRSEPTLEVSEFHLVKSGISDRDAVQIRDLARALGKKGHHFEVTKNLQAAQKKVSVLPKPLEKPEADRIKRTVGFENTKKEVNKWNAIITSNRVAESLCFPSNEPYVKSEPSTEFVKRFRLQSDLEKELAALEPQKENVEEKVDEVSLTLKEIIMKRKEAARIRAQQSYKEAKARRQNKIKSKKFHRVQKKEKIKLQLKEFEQLQKTDPEAALEKLEQLDKTRAEERMSLRHKNTGKWAKSKQIRAKYDKETRQELAQQLSVSRELTQKVKKLSDSEEEGEDDSMYVQPSVNDKENPWTGSTKTKSEIDEFVKSYRKYWDNKNNQLNEKEVNISTKSSMENKQINNSSKDTKTHNVLSDKRTDVDVNSHEIQNNKETLEPTNINNQISHLKPCLNLEGENNTCNAQSLETNKNLTTEEIKVKNVKNNYYKGVTQENMLNNNKILNKKAKLNKTNLDNVTATSNWNVESVENTDIKKGINNCMSNEEKINKIFDFAEEKIQDKIKSKLKRVTLNSNNHNKVKGKKRNKNVEYEKDNFDGLKIQTRKQKPILNIPLNESVNKNNIDLDTEIENTKRVKFDNTLSIHKSDTSKVEIDPNKYINVKPKHLNTDLPADITGGDEVLDDSENEEERRNVVSEAFADDDVVEDFRKEKEEEVKKSQPQDINLALPGWGMWGGKNIKISKRKKKRFILKAPKDLPRKDENKGDVIIFEQDDPKIKAHLVRELPYPFSSIKDYEASIRMPIGRNFIPENSHRKLIDPAIKTRMGKIIEPMNEDVLVKKDEIKRRKFVPKKKSIVTKKQINANNRNITRKKRFVK